MSKTNSVSIEIVAGAYGADAGPPVIGQTMDGRPVHGYGYASRADVEARVSPQTAALTWEDYRSSKTIPREKFQPVEWSAESAIHSHPVCLTCGFGMLRGADVHMYEACCALHFFGSGSEAHKHMVARAGRMASFTTGAKALDIHHPEATQIARPIVSESAASKLRSLGWTDEEIAAGSRRGVTVDDLKAKERAENPMIRRPWTGTLTEWVQLIEDHAPVYATTGDIVANLAKHFNVGAPTGERLARALFESDDDVIDHVRRVSEFRVKGCTVDEQRAAILRRDAATQAAWTRGHAGESPEWKWYVRAADRAKAMHAALGGGT